MRPAVPRAPRKPSDDAGSVLALCSIFLAIRGALAWMQAPEDAYGNLIRAALLLPLAVLAWKRSRWGLLAGLVGIALDGVHEVTRGIETGVRPLMMGIWVRMALVYLLSLAYRDARAPEVAPTPSGLGERP
jgi:hypothetical protein